MKSVTDYDRWVAVIDATEQACREYRWRRLNELLEAMGAKARTDEPPAAEADQWLMAIDQDTNRPRWFPRAETEEYHAMRFPQGVYGHA